MLLTEKGVDFVQGDSLEKSVCRLWIPDTFRKIFLTEVIIKPHQPLFCIKNSECVGEEQILIISVHPICTKQNPHFNAPETLILLIFSRKVWILSEL